MASNNTEISFPNKKRKIENNSEGNETEHFDNKKDVQAVLKENNIEEGKQQFR